MTSMPSPCRSIPARERGSIPTRRSSFILGTSHCYNIRPILLINPVLRLVLETAKDMRLTLISLHAQKPNCTASIYMHTKTRSLIVTKKMRRMPRQPDTYQAGIVQIKPSTTQSVLAIFHPTFQLHQSEIGNLTNQELWKWKRAPSYNFNAISEYKQKINLELQ